MSLSSVVVLIVVAYMASASVNISQAKKLSCMNRCTLCTLSLSLVVYILCSAVQCTSVNILFVRKWVQHSSTPLDWIIIVLQHCAQQGSTFPLSHIAHTGRTHRQTLNSL